MSFLRQLLCCGEKQQPPQRPGHSSTDHYFSATQLVRKIQTDRKLSFMQPSSDPFTLRDKYKGQDLKGVPNGTGEMMYKNGDYYRGEWVNGLKEGRGVMVYNEQGFQYQGEWKADAHNGQGKIVYENGSFYVGEFKENEKHGRGEFHDLEKKRLIQQWFENGVVRKEKITEMEASKEEEFPTLVLDKERFNSEDLELFEKQNQEIKELQVSFLINYYSICKIIELDFIKKNIKDWDDKEVREFLQAIDLTHCNETFYQNKIKGNHLITITEKEMKEDLGLKLGDRKRLLHYCQYLARIHNPDKAKRKKEARRNPTGKRGEFATRTPARKNISSKGSTNGKYAVNSSNFKTAVILEEDIIQEQSESFRDTFSNTNSDELGRVNGTKTNYKHKPDRKEVRQVHGSLFETDEFSQFYSGQIGQLTKHSVHREQRAVPRSQTSSSSTELSDHRKTASIRKKSSDNAEEEFHRVKNLVYNKSNVPNSQINQLLAIEADHDSQSVHSHDYDHSDHEHKGKRTIEHRNNNAGTESKLYKLDNLSNSNGSPVLSRREKNNENFGQLKKSSGSNDKAEHQIDGSEGINLLNIARTVRGSYVKGNKQLVSQSYQNIRNHVSQQNGHRRHRKNENSKIEKNESSSSSTSSEDSIDVKLCRYKTQEGGMEIRQLYEFLRQRGNLEFIIKAKDIDMLGLIGEGGYGKVYKGKYMGCPVAVKDYIKTGKHQNQEDFLKELEILSGLKHPNIVLYMGICITTDKYQLVTEFLEFGSLFDQIHKKKKRFSKPQILQIVDDMVKGMVYLHNMKNILHRDLKSSNVLIDQDWKVKLCDFGLSGHKSKSKKKNHGRIGTYQWMAPQVMKKEEMDFFSDVYSFGVIIWELITCSIPYEGYTEAQIIGEVGYDENYRLSIDFSKDSEWTQDDFMVQLMYECLQRVPTERPTFIQVQSKINDHFQKLQQINESNSDT